MCSDFRPKVRCAVNSVSAEITKTTASNHVSLYACRGMHRNIVQASLTRVDHLPGLQTTLFALLHHRQRITLVLLTV